MAERVSAPKWQLRVIAGLIGLVATWLVVVEVVDVVGGLHPHREKTTVGVGTIVVIQGLIGLPALLMAFSAMRAFGVVIDPRRSLQTAARRSAIAVAPGLFWLFLFVSAYGS